MPGRQFKDVEDVEDVKDVKDVKLVEDVELVELVELVEDVASYERVWRWEVLLPQTPSRKVTTRGLHRVRSIVSCRWGCRWRVLP